MIDNRLAQARQQARRTVRLIGAVYAAFGVAWILLSDSAVQFLDPAWEPVAQRYKGLAFIALTTLGLVLLMRWGYQKLFYSLEGAESVGRGLRGVFDQHPLPMWVYDRSTLEVLRVNDAALRMYGKTREEFLGKTLKDLVVPTEVPLLLQALKAPRIGNQLMGVFRHVVRDGQIAHLRQQELELTYDGRKAVIVTAEDVTDEMLARRAVELRESQLQQLHANLGEGLWLSSADGNRVIYMSPAFEVIYGRDVQEFRVDTDLWRKVVHPEDQQLAYEGAVRMRRDGVAATDYRIVRPDGSIRWVSDRRCFIHGQDGTLAMLGGVVEDITARKEHIAEQESLNTRLEHLVAERTRELEQTNVELQAFSHTAAHDLKTPLHGIAGMGHLLRTTYGQQLSPEGLQMAANIERSARDMGQLIDDLLRLSNVGSAKLSLQRHDLLPLIREVIVDLQRQEPTRQVHLVLPETLSVVCDLGLMRSLLLNVVGNAWKFTGQRSDARISVTAQYTSEFVEVTVADNGAGFSPEKADRLFKPFQRLHSQAQFKGTGLGLVTCRRIVQRHGGDIWLSSEPNVGTSVHFRLPSRQPSQPDTGPNTLSEPIGL